LTILAFAKPKAEEIAMNQHVSGSEPFADYGEVLARLAGTGFQIAPLQSLMYRQARGPKGG
jgi:hypothetical protein